MAEPGGPMVMLELAQPVAAALALARVRRHLAQAARVPVAIGAAQAQLRGVRPTLTFPTADQVRLGVAVEGGVRLASGRILTVDSFITATAAPQVVADAAGWDVRVACNEAQIDEPRLSYAGRDLPPEADRTALGLPSDDELTTLRTALADALRELAATLPEMPLTPTFVGAGTNVMVQIAPEAQGAALAVGQFARGPRRPWPLVTRPPQTAAVLVDGAAFTAAFATVVAPQISTLIAPQMGLYALAGTCAQDRIWFAAQARVQLGAVMQSVTATIETLARLEEGRVRLDVERVAVESDPGGETHAHALGMALTADIFCERLAGLAQAALQGAIAPLFGQGAADCSWQWAPPPETALPPLTYAAAQLRLTDGYCALIGAMHVPALGAPLDDVPDLDLRVDGTPVVQEDGTEIVATIVTVPPLPPAADCAWWTMPTGALLAEHGTTVAVTLRLGTDDPAATQPHEGAPAAPRQLTLHAAQIDAFGRVVAASIDLDAQALLMPPTARAAAVFAASRPGNATQATETRTRLATAYQPTVRQAQARSSILGMLAGVLAATALLSLLAVMLLTRSTAASTTAQATPLPPTATLAVTQVPHHATPTPQIATSTPAPTATPEAYGRFRVTPSALVIACATATPAPTAPATITPSPTPMPIVGTLMLANTGNATVDWRVQTFADAGKGKTVQSWAVVTPASGTLAPSASIAVSVTPDAEFCANTTTAYFIQFAAPPGEVAVPVNVSVSHP
jgi:hypothetical protein